MPAGFVGSWVFPNAQGSSAIGTLGKQFETIPFPNGINPLTGAPGVDTSLPYGVTGGKIGPAQLN